MVASALSPTVVSPEDLNKKASFKLVAAYRELARTDLPEGTFAIRIGLALGHLGRVELGPGIGPHPNADVLDAAEGRGLFATDRKQGAQEGEQAPAAAPVQPNAAPQRPAMETDRACRETAGWGGQEGFCGNGHNEVRAHGLAAAAAAFADAPVLVTAVVAVGFSVGFSVGIRT